MPDLINSINKITDVLENKNKELQENLMGKPVFNICGEDIYDVLIEMDLKKIADNKEKFSRLLDYIYHKLEIYWVEDVKSAVELGLEIFKREDD